MNANTQTPRTDAAEQRDITGLGVVTVDFARKLERELADYRDRTKEIIDEDHQRILALIHERDTYKARAEERRALRVEIEQALGMESKPGDTSDDALKQGLATIAALRAALARVTAERDEEARHANELQQLVFAVASERDDARMVANNIDAESLIAACIPGGSICDPQQVADAIREYLRRQEPCGGRCGDPECDLDTNGVTMRAPAKHCEDCAPEFGCFDGSEPCCKKPLVKSTPAPHADTVRAIELLAWCIRQMEGESGASASYWEEFQEYRQAVLFLDARKIGGTQ